MTQVQRIEDLLRRANAFRYAGNDVMANLLMWLIAEEAKEKAA